MNNATTDSTKGTPYTEPEMQAGKSPNTSFSRTARTLIALLECRRGHYVNSMLVDKYQHGLQTAYNLSVAYEQEPFEIRAQWVVAGLFHDVFGELSPANHADWIATSLHPFVSDRVALVLQMHDQMMDAHWNPCRPSGWQFRAANCEKRWFKDALTFMQCDIDAFSPVLIYPENPDYWYNEIGSVLP
jgi:hypothetical protein